MEREKEQHEYSKQQLLQERQAFLYEQAKYAEARAKQHAKQQQQQHQQAVQHGAPPQQPAVLHHGSGQVAMQHSTGHPSTHSHGAGPQPAMQPAAGQQALPQHSQQPLQSGPGTQAPVQQGPPQHNAPHSTQKPAMHAGTPQPLHRPPQPGPAAPQFPASQAPGQSVSYHPGIHSQQSGYAAQPKVASSVFILEIIA